MGNNKDRHREIYNKTHKTLFENETDTQRMKLEKNQLSINQTGLIILNWAGLIKPNQFGLTEPIEKLDQMSLTKQLKQV